MQMQFVWFFFFLSDAWCPKGAFSVVRGGAVHNEGSRSGALCKHGEWESYSWGQDCGISPRQREVWASSTMILYATQPTPQKINTLKYKHNYTITFIYTYYFNFCSNFIPCLACWHAAIRH